MNLSRRIISFCTCILGFPYGSAGKEFACNAEDLGSIPGLGRSPGEGKGYPLQYSGLENSMDCVGHEVAKSPTRLSDFHFHTCIILTPSVSSPGRIILFYALLFFFFFLTISCVIHPCVCAKSLQLCPTLCDPMDCSPTGSSVHGILQARILQWLAMPSSRGSS